MTQREENDKLLIDIMKQLNNILNNIDKINSNLREQASELQIDIAEAIANGRVE